MMSNSVSPPASGAPRTLSLSKYLPPIQSSLQNEDDSFYNWFADPRYLGWDNHRYYGTVRSCVWVSCRISICYLDCSPLRQSALPQLSEACSRTMS
ncbi:hypothetical protein M405DRAFT_247270 [Rhizopogon salebrosus TDB-379]|nr:hypothetical protein M405DRAFT_247270 [Rhizopogon salebrosus TDB-379]